MSRTSSVAAARILAARLSRPSQRGLVRTYLLRHTVGLGKNGRCFSSGSIPTNPAPESNRAPKEESCRPTNLDDGRSAILDAALRHVHEYGWTEDALAAGVVSAGLPPAMVGLVSGGRTDLVSFFMERCNDDLRKILTSECRPAWEAERTPVPERIERALRVRLEMVVPYIRSGRWHEGMALGVSSPTVAAVTGGQLDAMAGIVSEAAGLSSSEAFGAPGRAAIVSVYAAAELHLLTDENAGYEETWSFLRQRVRDLEAVAGVASKGPAGLAFNSDTVVAASAVATSLGGAVLSLARPAATGVVSAMATTVVPQIMTFRQPPQNTGASFSGAGSRGTKASDYNIENLPPFDAESSPSTKT